MKVNVVFGCIIGIRKIFLIFVFSWKESANTFIKCIHKVNEKERKVEKKGRGKNFILKYSRIYRSLRLY